MLEVSGSSVHICFFLSDAPFALILNPNVSAVRYLYLELISPIVQHPFCWFWVMRSQPFSSPLLWPFIMFISASAAVSGTSTEQMGNARRRKRAYGGRKARSPRLRRHRQRDESARILIRAIAANQGFFDNLE